jgi:hypothetical protein
MSDISKLKVNLGLMCTILLAMVALWIQTGRVLERLDTITAEVKLIRPLTDRVTYLEANRETRK